MRSDLFSKFENDSLFISPRSFSLRTKAGRRKEGGVNEN